jgi:hypothetical protein
VRFLVIFLQHVHIAGDSTPFEGPRQSIFPDNRDSAGLLLGRPVAAENPGSFPWQIQPALRRASSVL